MTKLINMVVTINMMMIIVMITIIEAMKQQKLMPPPRADNAYGRSACYLCPKTKRSIQQMTKDISEIKHLVSKCKCGDKQPPSNDENRIEYDYDDYNYDEFSSRHQHRHQRQEDDNEEVINFSDSQDSLSSD